jgi:hypothetical protein
VSPPLDELYFIWLCDQVEDESPQTHTKLLKLLFTKEFVWIVPNDDNRLEDGKNLRLDFIHDQDLGEVDPHWMNLGCSVLELMVGLSRQLSFMAEGEPRYWFWRLLGNLGLKNCSDDRRIPRTRIADILDRVVFRQYDPDGDGGLFPLHNPQENQREVELWYQLCAYVLELDSV